VVHLKEEPEERQEQMAANEFYTAAEAIARLEAAGLSESTFYRYVREGIITKELPKGRQRGALYPRDQVNEVLARHRGGSEQLHRATQDEAHPGLTDWVQSSDLPYLLALDYELYGPENVVEISIMRPWWERNHHMCRILYDAGDRRSIWGALTVMPLREEMIYRLLRGEMREVDIRADDILTYEDGHSYLGYVASAIIRPEHRARMRTLIRSVLHFWCEQHPHVKLDKLFAFAATDEGLLLMKHLFFSPRYDLGPDAFELDPYRPNPSPLIQDFQHCIRSKQ
jgi:predicted DNA-binding transcriptional regulator AlpA